MADFDRQVADWVGKTEEKLDVAVRKIALEMFSRVILKSPVDTGRFRANWQVAIGAIPSGTLELDDKTGQASIGRVQATALGMDAGDVITLVNNLPYAQRLENGYSAQAPAGMVMLSIQQFQSIASQIGFELVQI